MASKRMFDKAIIDTDRFMDLGMPAKALYFLLGMEADDEGFVSYKKVMRIHGGNDDDIKLLVAKGFLIVFESGVVVITDWNKNNYLDKNRIKETEYKKERKQILLTDSGEYVLNECLTSIEESSIEQSSIEERKTPSQIAISFFKGSDDFKSLLAEFSANNDHEVIQREFKKFVLYWTELNKSGTKQRWETERTFEVKKRLFSWLSRVKEFKGQITSKYKASSV